MIDKKTVLSTGIIGGGNMGEAIIKGLLTQEADLYCFDTNKERAAYLESEYSITSVHSLTDIVSRCKVLVLAVKPNQIKGVLEKIAPSLDKKSLLISVAAGVPLSFLKAHLCGHSNVIRVMPNTPCLVLEGASVLACEGEGAKESLHIAKEMFERLGKVLILDENLMDAVTGLSGSGPAFVFLAIDAMASGGVKMGLPRKDALLLAAQTVLGAANMVLTTGVHPEELRDRVSSPGGTTIAGIHQLEKGHFRSTIMNAVETAANRSKELGRRLKTD